MPMDLSALRVFVAGPSDVDDERSQLEDVVDELNSTWSDTLRVRLDLLTWRRRAVPGIGVDAQDVINRSMPEDYDIFIGIMWARFGSPTTRAGSGTEEEFNRALAKARAVPGSVHLMFYFKDDPVPPSQIDPAQVARVHAFRRRLEKDGVFYWGFTSPFAATIRVHLARQIQSWVSQSERPRAQSGVTSPPHTTQPEAEDEAGLIDSGDMFLAEMGRFGEARGRITTAIIDLHRAVVEEGPEIERGKGMDGVRRAMAWRAELLENLVAGLNRDIPVMAEAFKSAIDHLGKTIALAGEVGLPVSLQTGMWEQALTHAQATLQSDTDFIENFRTTLANTARYTTRLNRAKRMALAALDRLLAAYHHQIATFRQVAASPPTPAAFE